MDPQYPTNTVGISYPSSLSYSSYEKWQDRALFIHYMSYEPRFPNNSVLLVSVLPNKEISVIEARDTKTRYVHTQYAQLPLPSHSTPSPEHEKAQQCSALINDRGDEGTSMVILASGSAPGTHFRSYLPNR